MAVRNANILAARGKLPLFNFLFVSFTNTMQLLPMLSERYCSFNTPQKYLISNRQYAVFGTQGYGQDGMSYRILSIIVKDL
jgi:hypothetical protein